MTTAKITNNVTYEQKVHALLNINFFIGGLTEEGIEYYYNKMLRLGKIK